jgi:iron(III) transport system substrate-binding protein
VLSAYRSPHAVDIPPPFVDPQGYWTGFAGRARVLLVNREILAAADYPESIYDLLDPRWDAQEIGLAYPLFGTTATHAAALYAALGPEEGFRFFEQIQARGLRVVDGNSVVRDMVADGRLAFGLTDTDDACGALARGAPVEILFPDQDPNGLGTLVVPNTVALIAGGPNPDNGRALIDYLLSQSVAEELVEAGWSHVPLRPVEVRAACLPGLDVQSMQVNLQDIYDQLERAQDELAQLFIR